MIRYQLPVYSPVTVRGLVRAATAAFRAPEREALRQEIAARYGARRVELWGSGTEALQIAIRVAQRRVGGAVALPAFQCYDLAAAAVGAGVRVVLYDIEPATLAPDLDSLRRALGKGARAVVVAPLYGVPVPWEAIAGEVDRVGGVAIEDAAQGHGATWRDRPLGSWGALSVLSFGRGKGWCGGSGGALLARDGWEREEIPSPSAPGVADEARVLVRLKVQWLLGRPSWYRLPASLPGLHLGETVYHAPRNPRGIAKAAVGAIRIHCAASDREAQARRDNARALVAHSQVRGVDPPSGGVSGMLRFPMRIAGGAGAVPVHLGVARSYPAILSTLGPLQERMLESWPCPGAETLARELVTLPVHSRVTDADRWRVLAWLSGHGRGRR